MKNCCRRHRPSVIGGNVVPVAVAEKRGAYHPSGSQVRAVNMVIANRNGVRLCNLIVAPTFEEVLIKDFRRGISSVGARNPRVDRSRKERLGVKQSKRIHQLHWNLVAWCAVWIRSNRAAVWVALEGVAKVASRLIGIRARAVNVINLWLACEIAIVH